MRDHRKLKAFDLADNLAVLTYRETTGFPREEVEYQASIARRLDFLNTDKLEESAAETARV